MFQGPAFFIKTTEDLHAKTWEGHWMAFDPDIRQDARIRIAHQL